MRTLAFRGLVLLRESDVVVDDSGNVNVASRGILRPRGIVATLEVVCMKVIEIGPVLVSRGMRGLSSGARGGSRGLFALVLELGLVGNMRLKLCITERALAHV